MEMRKFSEMLETRTMGLMTGEMTQREDMKGVTPMFP